MLCKYVTTIYDSKHSPAVSFLKRLLPQGERSRLASRRTEELDEADVLCFCTIAGFEEAVLSRVDRGRRVYRWWHIRVADRFGEKVAQLAVKERADAVVMYDTTAKKCFEVLKEKAPHILRVMDCSAANRIYMRKVYSDDMKISPCSAKKLMKERGHLMNDRYCERLTAEIEATDVFLAPSEFVKKSLEYSSVPADRILLCAYGTNYAPIPHEKAIDMGDKLQAVYVGNVTAMKGIHYLLQAAEHLRDKVHLTVVGSYDNSDHFFDSYVDVCTFVGRVPHKSVQEYLKKADVFVFPSLGEGLSLAVLEAMACGLPCIVSENSGANDAIREGENGFVVKAHSAEEITEKLLWCCDNKEKLPAMGQKAMETAMRFTWKEYAEGLTRILNEQIAKRETSCMG